MTFDHIKRKMVPTGRDHGGSGGPSGSGRSLHRDDELLLTFDHASDFKFQNISSLDITKKIIALGIGKIKRNVQPQPIPDCPGEYNQNKYCILEGLKPGDKERIPPYFEFKDPNFGDLIMWINYPVLRRISWRNV